MLGNGFAFSFPALEGRGQGRDVFFTPLHPALRGERVGRGGVFMNSNITFELRRPFGGPVITSNNPGTLHNQFTTAGRRGAGDIGYTHILDVPDSFDIRDGCLRGLNTSGLAYGDGDEIRIPDDSG